MDQYTQQRTQLATLTIPQLKAHLKARNLKVGGRKDELITRLMTPVPAAPQYPAPAPAASPAAPVPTVVHFTGQFAGLPPLTVFAQPKAPRRARSPRRAPAKKTKKKTKAKSPGRSPKKISAGRSFKSDLEALTVPQLKAILKAKKEKVSGKKIDLVLRIAALHRGKSRAVALQELNIPALKSILKARYQKVSGKKAELVARVLSGDGVGTQKPRATSPRATKKK